MADWGMSLNRCNVIDVGSAKNCIGSRTMTASWAAVDDSVLCCSTTTLYHLQRSLQLSPSATALLNIGDLSYAGMSSP